MSLDRIREQLNKPAESRLHNLDVKADFTVQIAEQRRIDEIMSKLDFKTGPAPAGGLYGYEQQRMLFNPTDHPLQQPYAAFSGGEFVTIAIENLIAKYPRRTRVERCFVGRTSPGPRRRPAEKWNRQSPNTALAAPTGTTSRSVRRRLPKR